MDILFDSRRAEYKSIFGTLRVGERCRFCVKLPLEIAPQTVTLVSETWSLPLAPDGCEGDYALFAGELCPTKPGLFFYRFDVQDKNGAYRLFRRGRGTNIEEGELWQLSVLPADYAPPEELRGAVYYQIFPDRFCRAEAAPPEGKLTPYTLRPFEGFVPSAPDASDFAGGNLRGILSKLDYLRELGVRVIYLNPIFMACSNHRYDTADYRRIDPLLGTEADFRALCDAAHERGMKIMLDGVFSHCGKISRYFDADGRFGGGACSAGTVSPYYKWFDFTEFPRKYACWWGIESLPNIHELDEDYLDFIIRDEDSVVAHWLAAGADGFRLDVADELPDAFIALLRERVRECKPGAAVIGEVWEDASNKEAYGVRRRYFTGAELDGVINFPLRKAILAFASGEDDGSALAETVMTLAENYPAAALDCTMSILGNHDTERLARLLPELPRRRLAVFLQFTLPGSPVIYYGDEAGLDGGRDPMNRLCFPWGRENRELTELYRQLAVLKNAHTSLRRGRIEFLEAGDGRVRFVRTDDTETVECMADAAQQRFELQCRAKFTKE